MQTFSAEVPGGLDWAQNWEDYVSRCVSARRRRRTAGSGTAWSRTRSGTGEHEGLLRIIEAVDSPALGVNLDPSHLFPVGDMPHVAVYRLGGRVLHCHFSDNDGETNVHWRPGMGKIDWRDLLRALADTGFDGVIWLEFEDIPGVSRNDGHGAYRGNVEATDGFVEECRTALGYLTGLANEVGLNVE